MKVLLNCDDVLECLTGECAPPGDESALQEHLESCATCRHLADARQVSLAKCKLHLQALPQRSIFDFPLILIRFVMFTYYRFSRLRVVLGVVCFASIIFAPWWVTALLAFLLSVRFRAWEIILAGFFMDLYWMPSGVLISNPSFDTLPLATMVSLLFLFGLEPLRRQLLVGPEII